MKHCVDYQVGSDNWTIWAFIMVEVLNRVGGVFLFGTKVMDENCIWQCADSVKMHPTSYWNIWS